MKEDSRTFPRADPAAGARRDAPLPAQGHREPPADVLPADDEGTEAPAALNDLPEVVLAESPTPKAARRPADVVEVVETERPRAKKRSSGGTWLVVGLVAALLGLVVCGGVGVGAWLFLGRGLALAPPVRLSNARMHFVSLSVDYEFTSGAPVPGTRYVLVLRATRTGQTTEANLNFLQKSGTVDMRIFGGGPRLMGGPFEVWFEARGLGGGATRISNVVTAR